MIISTSSASFLTTAWRGESTAGQGSRRVRMSTTGILTTTDISSGSSSTPKRPRRHPDAGDRSTTAGQRPPAHVSAAAWFSNHLEVVARPDKEAQIRSSKGPVVVARHDVGRVTWQVESAKELIFCEKKPSSAFVRASRPKANKREHFSRILIGGQQGRGQSAPAKGQGGRHYVLKCLRPRPRRFACAMSRPLADSLSTSSTAYWGIAGA